MAVMRLDFPFVQIADVNGTRIFIQPMYKVSKFIQQLSIPQLQVE